MREERIILSPGPVHIAPSGWAAIRPIHHRSDEFRVIVRETEMMIGELLGTESPVYTITASGTGGMEFAVVNLTSPGTKILVVSGGKFGDRWSEMCSSYGCWVNQIQFRPGAAIDVAKIVRRLEMDRCEIIALTHVESSTGLLTPIRELIDALPRPRPVILLDAIASLGVEALEMDAWGVDAVVAASQKAFAAPPGVSFVALSPRAIQWTQQVNRRHSYYLSLKRYEEARGRGDTPFTPAIHTLQIMHHSLRAMREIGWQRVRDRHRVSARACMKAATHMSLESFPENPSDAVQAFTTPLFYESRDLVSDLAEREGIIVARGYKAHGGALIRIGYLGLHGGKTLERAMLSMATVLADGGCFVDREALRGALAPISDQEDLVL